MKIPNKERIEKWIDALRSGDYQQTKEVLHDSKGYCCLGVACEIYRQETERGDWKEDQNAGDSHDALRFVIPDEDESTLIARGNSYTIIPEVRDWFGLPEANPDLLFPREDRIEGDSEFYEESAASANDEGMSFSDIADAIERTFLRK